MTRAAAAVLAVALVACSSPSPAPPDSTPGPAGVPEGRTVGVVRVVGSAPMNVQVVLQPAEGRGIQLVGPLGEELRQLSGAEVAVSGPVEPSPDPMADRRMRVDRYDILSVDGEPVVSGTVEGVSGGWTLLRTASGELVYLGGATGGFQTGQKVWVQGPRAVVVQSHGVLRR